MSTKENKRQPNKPTLSFLTKRPPQIRNVKKNSLSSSHNKNLIKKSSSDTHFDDIYSNQHKDKQEKAKHDFINDSNGIYSNLSPKKITLSPQRNSSKEHLYHTYQKNTDDDEIIQSDYSQGQHTDAHQYSQSDDDENSYHSDDPSNFDNYDAKLGKKIRRIFNNKSDNDIIINDIKIFVKFIKTMNPITNDFSIESFIDDLQSQIHENIDLRAKNDELLRKSEKLEKQLKNSEDQQICRSVRTFYSTKISPTDSRQIAQQVSKDLDFSLRVRNVFDSSDNYEAIIRTIESNKEDANDNKIIAELTTQLQKANINAEICKDVSIQNQIIQQLNNQHRQEVNEKDSQIRELNDTIDHLRIQIDDLSKIIENDKKEIEEEREKHENEIRQMISFKNQDANENAEQVIFLKQSYENQINKLKQEIIDGQISYQKVSDENIEKDILFEQKEKEIKQIKKESNLYLRIIEQKENEINQYKESLSNKEIIEGELRKELFAQQRLNGEKQKENIELRNIIKNSEDIKDNEISYLQKELLSSLEKQKKTETQLTKLMKKYNVDLTKETEEKDDDDDDEET